MTEPLPSLLRDALHALPPWLPLAAELQEEEAMRRGVISAPTTGSSIRGVAASDFEPRCVSSCS